MDEEGAARTGAQRINARNDSALLTTARGLGEQGLYAPRVDHVLPLESIVEAHTLAAKRSGKIVITVV